MNDIQYSWIKQCQRSLQDYSGNCSLPFFSWWNSFEWSTSERQVQWHYLILQIVDVSSVLSFLSSRFPEYPPVVIKLSFWRNSSERISEDVIIDGKADPTLRSYILPLASNFTVHLAELYSCYLYVDIIDSRTSIPVASGSKRFTFVASDSKNQKRSSVSESCQMRFYSDTANITVPLSVSDNISNFSEWLSSLTTTLPSFSIRCLTTTVLRRINLQDLNISRENLHRFELISVFPLNRTDGAEDFPSLPHRDHRKYVTVSDTNLNKDILDLYASQHILVTISSYPTTDKAVTEDVIRERTVVLGSIHDYEGNWVESCEVIGREGDTYVVSVFIAELSNANTKNATRILSDLDSIDMSLFDVHLICEGTLSPLALSDERREEDFFQSVELTTRVSSKIMSTLTAFDSSSLFSVGWLTIKIISNISKDLPAGPSFSDISMILKNEKLNFIDDINSKMLSLFPVQPDNLIQYDNALSLLSLICFDIARSPYNPMNISKSLKYYFHQLNKIFSYFISYSSYSSPLTIVPCIHRFISYFDDSQLILSLLFTLNVYFQEWLTSNIAQQLLSLRSLSSSLSSVDFNFYNLASDTTSRFESFDQFYQIELASSSGSSPQFTELKKIIFLLSVVKHFLNEKKCLVKYSQNDWKKILKLEITDISYLQEISLDFLEILYNYRYYLLSVMFRYLENESENSFYHIGNQLQIIREVSLLASELLDFISGNCFMLNPTFNPKEHGRRKFCLPSDGSVEHFISFLSLSFERFNAPLSPIIEKNIDILFDIFIKSFYQIFLRFDYSRNNGDNERMMTSGGGESRSNHDELSSLMIILKFIQSHLVPFLSNLLLSDAGIFIIDKAYEIIGMLHSVFRHLFNGLVGHDFLSSFPCFSNLMVADGDIDRSTENDTNESIDSKNRIILFYLSELIKFYHRSFDDNSSTSSPTGKEFSLFFDSSSLQPAKPKRNSHHPIHSASSNVGHNQSDFSDLSDFSFPLLDDDYQEGISFLSSQSTRMRSLLLVNEIVMEMERVVAEKKIKSEKYINKRTFSLSLTVFGSYELIKLKSFCYLFWKEVIAKESKFLTELSLMKRLFCSCSVSSYRDSSTASVKNSWLVIGLQTLWECFLQIDNRFFSFYQAIRKQDESKQKHFSFSSFSNESVSIQDFSILLLHYFSCYNSSSMLIYGRNLFTCDDPNDSDKKERSCLVNERKKSLFQLTKDVLLVIIQMIDNVYCSKDEWGSSESIASGETSFTYFSYFLEIFLFSLREIIGIHFIMTVTSKLKLLSSPNSVYSSSSSSQVKELIKSLIYFIGSNDWNENIEYLFDLLKMISFLSLRIQGEVMMINDNGNTFQKRAFAMNQVLELFANEVFSMIVEIVSFQSVYLFFQDSPDHRHLLISEKDLAKDLFVCLSASIRSSCLYLSSTFDKLFKDMNTASLSQNDRNMSHLILYRCLIAFINEIPSFSFVQNQSMLHFLSDSRLWFLSLKFSFLQTIEEENKDISLSSSGEQKETSKTSSSLSSTTRQERLINILYQNYISIQLFSSFQNRESDITAVVKSESCPKMVSSMNQWVSYFRTDILCSSRNKDSVIDRSDEGNDRHIFFYLNQSCLAFYSLQRFFLRLCLCQRNSKSDGSSNQLLLQILENEQDITFFREALQSLLSCGCWEVGVELSQFMLFLVENCTEATTTTTPSNISKDGLLPSPIKSPHSTSRHLQSFSPVKAGPEQPILSSFSSTSKSILLPSLVVPASPSSPPVISLLSPKPSFHTHSPFRSSHPSSSSSASSHSLISPVKRKETFKSEIQRILSKFQDKLKFDGSLRFSKQYLAVRLLTSSSPVFPVKSSSLLTEEARIFLNKIESLNLINLSVSEEIQMNDDTHKCWSESWLLLSFDMLSFGNIAELFHNDYLEFLQYEKSEQFSSLSSPLTHTRIVEEVNPFLFFLS
jgi:hypothetical protein